MRTVYNRMLLLRFRKLSNKHTKLKLENHSSVSILTAFFGALDFTKMTNLQWTRRLLQVTSVRVVTCVRVVTLLQV